MPKILFVGENNACRSRMAQAFTVAMAPFPLEAISAGYRNGVVHPMVSQVLAEVGVAVTDGPGFSLGELGGQSFDLVVVLSPRVREQYPALHGLHGVLWWNLDDPLATPQAPEALLEAMRRCRDQVRVRVETLFRDGYFHALLTLKENATRVLDSLAEGLVAHDLSRRIFFFNRAAERITGYAREEVLGRDCYDVFPGGFCGHKCSFQESGACVPERQTGYSVNITTKSGETRQVEVSVVPMRDNAGRTVGVLASYHDQTRLLELERRLGEKQEFAGIITRDHKMFQIFDLIRAVANSNAPVLIQGETGTGKELVAAAIHREGWRARGPFVAVNCGALPQGTLESELFGHVKGAFTGAIRDKKGRFALADGGTIFLDEVGELPAATQVKLLRVLQEGTFEPVGGERTVKVQVRVISATNRDLKELVARGEFREDLYYRLCVVPINLPPLRERRNDIPLLATHFLERYAAEEQRSAVKLSSSALAALMDYHWPGNVRQLENAIRFALVKCPGRVIEPEHLPPEITVRERVPAPARLRAKLTPEAIEKALEAAGDNKLRAAKLLGVSRATLYRYLRQHLPPKD
ncbi:MAG: sigma 54-interacting transcriptional regulator [Clostridia bacterium]|nr:sigma 54-interacting transcriptional regulator [Clostridia bacterium]